jgi:hypothetical protein
VVRRALKPNQSLQQTGAADGFFVAQGRSAAPAAELCRSAAEGFSRVNTVRFELQPAAAREGVGVGIWVDGESLIRRLEAPWWASIGAPQPDGQYVWVPARVALPPSRHLLGEPADGWCGEYSVLVVCNCGEYACRAYAARIEVSGSHVRWSAWAEFPAEEARLGGLLPLLTFDLAQYTAALLRVAEQRHAEPDAAADGGAL